MQVGGAGDGGFEDIFDMFGGGFAASADAVQSWSRAIR